MHEAAALQSGQNPYGWATVVPEITVLALQKVKKAETSLS